MKDPTNKTNPMWDWFGLSYSGYLVLQRALICGMSDEWQAKLVELLDEMEATYDSEKLPANFHVTVRANTGRFVRDPFANYRHPPTLPYKDTVANADT